MTSGEQTSEVKLNPRQRHILQTLAETMLPPNVGFPIAPDTTNLVIPIEKLLSPLRERGMKSFGLLLYLFEWAALVFLPRFKPFTKLSPTDREKYLIGWEKSRIKYRRWLMLTLKALVCLVFFSDPNVKAAVGYDPECLVEKKS